MRKPRRAKLIVKQTDGDTSEAYRWVRLVARNGKILLAGEVLWEGTRARAAIVRAMVDVLESEGYVVTKAEEAAR